MSGFVGSLSQEQQDALVLFKATLSGASLLRKKDDDYTLARFLRARSWDVEKATTMFQNMLAWRADIRADSIKEVNFPEKDLIKQHYPHFHHFTDKLGRPVYIERLGQLQVEELMKHTTTERLLLHHVKEWEILLDWKLPACSKAAGRHVEQCLTILDLEGVSLKHMTKPVRNFIQGVSKIDQDYYPEHLGKMLIINAPTSFKAIWSMVKPFLDKRTQKKIDVHGKDYEKHLKEFIDEAKLPHFFGGSCRCPSGCENADPGPWNEE